MNAKQSSIDYNPATGEIIGSVANTDLSRFGLMMEKARTAQQIWATYSFAERKKYIKKMRRYIVENADNLALTISNSNGKTLTDALATEILPCALSCQWYPKAAAKLFKPKMRRPSSIMFAQKRSQINYLPLGVVGIISPWNYPLSIPFGDIIMALCAGNAVVLKVADATSQVGVAIEEIVKSACLPEGLFQMLYARGSDASNAMFENGIDKIFFTGSVQAGKSIMTAAAKSLTPVTLELGGNDPAIILNDADIERATNGIVWGAFQNNGQSCAGIERIYVQEGIYAQFMQVLIKKVKNLRVGEPQADHSLDVGAMTTANQRDIVKQHLQDALDKGAKIVAESSFGATVNDNGFYHPSVVLENCTPDMAVVKEETFGPLLAVLKFNNIEQVIQMANDSDLALTTSIWSKNIKQARKIALRLESGVTTINDHLLTQGMAELPWGGWKNSGIGRTHGEEGMLEMVNAKVVNWDIFNTPRNLWWYPHNDGTYDSLKNALYFVFPKSLKQRILSLVSVKQMLIMLKKMLLKG